MRQKIFAVIFALLACSVPAFASALTLYSYAPGAGFVATGEYAPKGIEKVAEDAFQSVVTVEGYKKEPVYDMEIKRNPDTGSVVMNVLQTGTSLRKATSGSGFFVASDGYILTNRHVVDDPGATYTVRVGSLQIPARIAYKDERYDLAVLKIDGNGYPVLRLGDSSEMRAGDAVASVGNALGKFVDSLSSGNILSFGETVVARESGSAEVLDGLMATDAKLYPGDSGGPLLNSKGEVVGVNVAIEVGSDTSFSIPSNAARTVLVKLGILAADRT